MPEFASQDYWNERFEKNTAPHDWLISARNLRDITTHWVSKADLPQSEILHIGCGTSNAFCLRDLVAHPEQIYNVDYSQVAIDAGSAREKTSLKDENVNQPTLVETTVQKAAEDDSTTKPQQCMRWAQMDLLSIPTILDLMEEQAEHRGRFFDVIIDKSTSDSIACGQPVSPELPYPLSINGWSQEIPPSEVRQVGQVHPLHILAVHLAALTAPNTGRWIVVSYSEDRFPFLPPYPQSVAVGLLADHVIRAGFPHPSTLWRLVAKERLEVATKGGANAGSVHHYPVSHWLYVLERTEAVVV